MRAMFSRCCSVACIPSHSHTLHYEPLPSYLSGMMGNTPRSFTLNTKKLCAGYQTQREQHHDGPEDCRDQQKQKPFECWACAARADKFSFFCTECHRVQPPCPQCDFFLFFGLYNSLTASYHTVFVTLYSLCLLFFSPQKFGLDLDALTAQYKALQRLLHPDTFSQKSPTEQYLSALQSATINQAYNTLRSPTLRASYLLKLKGVNVDEDSARESFTDETLLSEVLETREQVEAAQTLEEVERLAQINDKKLQQCVQDLTLAFDRDHDLERARYLTTVLHYLTRIHEEIQNKKFQLSGGT
jgi:molecular chaperone HscB